MKLKDLLLRILLLEKLPYLLSLLFIGAGALVTYVHAFYESQPLIEYEVEFEEKVKNQDKVGYRYTLEIENITSKTTFSNLIFLVDLARDTAELLYVRPYFLPPTYIREMEKDPIPPFSYELTIKNFQPGANLFLEVIASKKRKPSLSVYSAEQVKVLSGSFMTFLFKNQIIILILLGFVYVDLIIIYLILYAWKKKD